MRKGRAPCHAMMPPKRSLKWKRCQRRPRARSLRPLRALIPFISQYPGRVLPLFLRLAATAATLAMPIAVRFMIDNGFSTEDASSIDRYFLAMLVVAIVLVWPAPCAFILFLDWRAGDRRLRAAVYNHITTLSPAFFEVTRTGEVLSRLTADTTLIMTVVGSSASIALRNLFMFVGSAIMLVYTSASLAGLAALTLPAVIVPVIVGLGRMVRRLARASQDRIADTASHATETISAMQTVQSFTHENEDRRVFSNAVEGSFDTAKLRILARAGMTAIAIVLIFAGVTGILWLGAQSVLDGTMSGGTLGQFILYAVLHLHRCLVGSLGRGAIGGRRNRTLGRNP